MGIGQREFGLLVARSLRWVLAQPVPEQDRVPAPRRERLADVQDRRLSGVRAYEQPLVPDIVGDGLPAAGQISIHPRRIRPTPLGRSKADAAQRLVELDIMAKLGHLHLQVMIGLALSPGTAVEPMWSKVAPTDACTVSIAALSRSRNRSATVGHRGSDGCSTAAEPAVVAPAIPAANPAMRLSYSLVTCSSSCRHAG